MSLTVQNLLEAPQLDLRLLGGASGLRNTVEWVHICDLPDPWNWMGEKQVMLTNGQSIPELPQQQVEVLVKLRDAGVAACGVGDAMGAAPFTAEALHTAQHIGLPLFAVPFPLPFAAVAKTVADAASVERGRRLHTTSRLYDLLGAGDHAPLLTDQFLRSVADLIGFDVALIDGICAHPWSDHLDEPAWLDGIAPISRPGEEGGIATLWKTREAEVLQALPVRTAPGCTALFRPRAGEHHDTSVLLHAASVLGTIVSHFHLDGVLRNRRLVEYVDRILNERSQLGGPNPFWLRELGYTAETPSRGAVLTGGTAEQRDNIVQRLQRHGVPLAATMRAGQLLLVIHETGVENGRNSVEMLRHVQDHEVRIGVGTVVPATDIVTSLQQAMWALELSAPDQTSGVVPFAPGKDWFGFQNPRQGEAFCERVLGSLLTGDAAHRELLSTLQTYLEQDRSPQKTSKALHLHRQTVNQRLKRVEALLGRELRSTETVTEIWIALRLLQATGHQAIM